VLLEDTDQTDHYVEQFRRRFPQSATRLAFIPWHERADFYNKTVALFSTQLRFLRLIIAAIIVLGISNILVMNVMERTGEIGTLLALGARRRRILSQFAAEGVILGLVGGLLGVALAVALAQAISAIGIPMPPPPNGNLGYTASIRVVPSVLAMAFAVGFAATTLAALLPAYRASRTPVADALRENV
jgi:putative ABC transport system permease protein